MTDAPPKLAKRALPSRSQALAFFAKAWIFRALRVARDPLGSKPRRLQKCAPDFRAPVLAESRSLLYTSTVAAEFALQAGKIHNLRTAARKLDGLVIPAGKVFSFWAHVPRPTRLGGFVRGRELREGCIVPNTGGGLCQLSNALYDAALTAGFEIVERHAHSAQMPGSMAAAGRDATVFWNYVDLRFRAAVDWRLEVSLNRDELIVCFRSPAPISPASATGIREQPAHDLRPAVESCETCGMTGCFRHADVENLPAEAVTAWLVDAWWPEHDDHMQKNHRPCDWLFTPLNSRRFGIGPYRWSRENFAEIRKAPWFVVERSLQSRRLSAQGAARQRALLRMDEKLACHCMRRLPFTATHLVVSQNLLPFLWKEGALGGRTFDVLMTRLPLAELQGTLDRAAAQWPESKTLADFRAPGELLAAETAALAAARHWITPHSAIAHLAGARAVKLDWKTPEQIGGKSRTGGKNFFPASTLGRKGAYEVRAAAKALGLGIILGGPVLETDAFWNGIETTAKNGSLPADILAVVLPAWVENQPRRLLNAAAAGIPVIASENCGLSGVPGVQEVKEGDANSLQNCLFEMLHSSGVQAGSGATIFPGRGQTRS